MEKTTHTKKLVALVLCLLFTLVFGQETINQLKEIDLFELITGTVKPGIELCVYAILFGASALGLSVLWESCKRD